MAPISDLRELKASLDINPNDTGEDKKLLFFLEQASEWISEALNRPGLFQKPRTEYYKGTGTTKLLLKSRPVVTTPTIQCWVDENGHWGETSGAFTLSNAALTYGTDFVLEIDQDDGASRSGTLWRLGAYWPRPSARQKNLLTPFIDYDKGSVKVTYTGGFTYNNLPSNLRLACNYLVAKMRQVIPLGFFLTSESYEERSVAYFIPNRRKWLGDIWDMICYYRNWHF